MKRFLLRAAGITLLLFWAGLAQMACSSSGNKAHPGLNELWREFRTLPPARALAITGDPERRWLGAAVGGRESQADANRGALEECQKRRVLRRVQAPCRLYAVGNEIVWEAW